MSLAALSQPASCDRFFEPISDGGVHQRGSESQ